MCHHTHSPHTQHVKVLCVLITDWLPHAELWWCHMMADMSDEKSDSAVSRSAETRAVKTQELWQVDQSVITTVFKDEDRNVSKKWDVGQVMKTPRSDYNHYNSSSGENGYCHSELSNSCGDVSLKNWIKSLFVAREERSAAHLSRWVHRLGTENIWHWVWADFPTSHRIIRNLDELLEPEQKSEDAWQHENNNGNS